MQFEGKFWRPAWAVALAMLLVGCSKPTPADGVTQGPDTGSANAGDKSNEGTFLMSMMEAKEKMADVLKDPGSAQYKDAVAYPFVTGDGTTLYIVCGRVNAKNGLGGYMGYERFIATPEGDALESEAGDFETGWNQHCIGTPRHAVGF